MSMNFFSVSFDKKTKFWQKNTQDTVLQEEGEKKALFFCLRYTNEPFDTLNASQAGVCDKHRLKFIPTISCK